MLCAEIHVRSIDYERTFYGLFPLLMETVRKMDGENLMIYMLKELGETSRSLVPGILQELSRKHRDEVLCRLVSFYRKELSVQMNQLLALNGFGDCISVEWLEAQQEEQGFLLTLNNIKVDFAELLKIEKVSEMIGDAAENSKIGQAVSSIDSGYGGLLKKAVAKGVHALGHQKGTHIVESFFRGSIEKKGIKYLEEKYLPEELGRMVGNFLEEKNIFAEVSGVELRSQQQTAPADRPEYFLTRELEYALVDAVVAYLKKYEASEEGV